MNPERPQQPVKPPGAKLTVNLVKNRVPHLRYPVEVVFDDGIHIVVLGTWADMAERDVGYVRFENGDVWTEHYWRDRWYSVKEVRSSVGALKGWYCDVARPVRVEGHQLLSDDLYLDLWASADRRTILHLDEEEFVASGIVEQDPETAAAARHALQELDRLAHDGFPGLTQDAPD